jgi:hypothetical protein
VPLQLGCNAADVGISLRKSDQHVKCGKYDAMHG